MVLICDRFIKYCITRCIGNRILWTNYTDFNAYDQIQFQFISGIKQYHISDNGKVFLTQQIWQFQAYCPALLEIDLITDKKNRHAKALHFPEYLLGASCRRPELASIESNNLTISQGQPGYKLANQTIYSNEIT